MSQPRDPITGQPVGVPVDTTPAQLPGPVALQGRHGRKGIDPQRQVVADHLATVLSGGAAEPWVPVTEEHVLELERRVLVHTLQERR